MAANSTVAQSLLKELLTVAVQLDANDLPSASEAFHAFTGRFYEALAEGTLDRTDFLIADVRVSIAAAYSRSGRTLRVGQAGDFASIQAAVQAASAGDIIAIEPGRYEEQVLVDKPGLTLQTVVDVSDRPRDAIRVQIKGSLTITADGVTVQGLTITGASQDGVMIESASYVTLQDVAITRNAKTGIAVRGQYAYLLLENNRIDFNGLDGVHLQGRDGYAVAILGSDISNNGRSNARGVGVRTDAIRDVVISGSTLVNNPFAALHPQDPPQPIPVSACPTLTSPQVFHIRGTSTIRVDNTCGKGVTLQVDNRGPGMIVVAVDGRPVTRVLPGQVASVEMPAGAVAIIGMELGVGQATVILQIK